MESNTVASLLSNAMVLICNFNSLSVKLRTNIRPCPPPPPVANVAHDCCLSHSLLWQQRVGKAEARPGCGHSCCIHVQVLQVHVLTSPPKLVLLFLFQVQTSTQFQHISARHMFYYYYCLLTLSDQGHSRRAQVQDNMFKKTSRGKVLQHRGLTTFPLQLSQTVTINNSQARITKPLL